MTDFEQKLIEEIQSLRAEMSAMRSEFALSKITYFENLPIDAVVGCDYVAYRFGTSETAVRRGRFNTGAIPRLREKPIAFLKRNVDAVFQEKTRPPKEKAAKLRHNAKRKTNKL